MPECNGTYTFSGLEKGKSKWTKIGNISINWTHGGWWELDWGDCVHEARIKTPVPPLEGYYRDGEKCDIRVSYEKIYSE